MNFYEEFLKRKGDFHSTIKRQVLDELKEKCPFDVYWFYEDGYFYSPLKNNTMLCILKSDFEPYVFSTLAVLPEVGHPLEYDVGNTDDVASIIKDLLEEQVED